jgi:hypothetical protein
VATARTAMTTAVRGGLESRLTALERLAARRRPDPPGFDEAEVLALWRAIRRRPAPPPRPLPRDIEGLSDVEAVEMVRKLVRQPGHRA